MHARCRPGPCLRRPSPLSQANETHIIVTVVARLLTNVSGSFSEHNILDLLPRGRKKVSANPDRILGALSAAVTFGIFTGFARVWVGGSAISAPYLSRSVSMGLPRQAGSDCVLWTSLTWCLLTPRHVARPAEVSKHTLVRIWRVCSRSYAARMSLGRRLDVVHMSFDAHPHARRLTNPPLCLGSGPSLLEHVPCALLIRSCI